MLINRKRRTSFLLLLIFFFSSYTMSHAFADPVKQAPISSPNPDTLRLFQDCQMYLDGNVKPENICAATLDIAVMSYVGGQVFLLGVIGDEKIQNDIGRRADEYILNAAKCKREDDPVLSYGGGMKIREVAVKFVDGMKLHPDWLEMKPSQVLLGDVLSFYCGDRDKAAP